MDVDEVVEFLEWLEQTWPIRLEFTDKRALAEGFVEQRSDRLYRRLQVEQAAKRRTALTE